MNEGGKEHPSNQAIRQVRARRGALVVQEVCILRKEGAAGRWELRGGECRDQRSISVV